MGEHKCFTAETTAYLRNLSHEERSAKTHAVLYQRPFVETKNGISMSMRFPLLIVTGYVEEQAEIAAKIARILEEHWEDPA